MTREILFKAKRIDNGEWVEGTFTYLYETVMPIIVPVAIDTHENIEGIDSRSIFHIDPNTLSQFTGLLDKNGNKIFENDILQREDGATYWCFYNSNKGLFNLYAYEEDPFDTWERWEVSINDFLRGGLEIVGNIHDTEQDNA